MFDVNTFHAVLDIANNLAGEARINAPAQESEYIPAVEMGDRVVDQSGINAGQRLGIVEQHIGSIFAVFHGPVVCRWLGNSAMVANAHYLQVTDADYERASHYASQSALALSGHEQSGEAHKLEIPWENRGDAIPVVYAEMSYYPRQDSNLQPTD